MTQEAESLSRNALSFLLGMINTPRMEIAFEYFNSSGVMEEILTSRLLFQVNTELTGLFIDGKDRELIHNSNGPGYRYFSEVSGWVQLPEKEHYRFRVDTQRLLKLIRGWLDISNHQPLANLQSESIWDLGDLWVGKRRLAILFMRRAHLAKSVSHLHNVLLNFPRRRSAMVLTDVPINSYGPSLAGTPLCIALNELLLPEQHTIDRIDKNMISELLGDKSNPVERRQSIWCSDDGSELKINEDTYIFTGLTQQRIIRQLFDAWEAGQSRLRTSAVLFNAESKASAMSQAFSGNKNDWKKVVGYGDGFCWLKT